MRKVYIMRGIPGSGKSSWIKENLPAAKVVSADHYFTDKETGEYKFVSSMLPAAHDHCLVRFLDLIRSQDEDVVVDNTNVRMFEVSPYYRLAEVFFRTPEIVWVHCHPGVAACRNVHGVPSQQVESMARSFEPLPPWWTVRHVYN